MSAIICNMATKKDPKQKENQARKPVAQKAMADTSGGSLANFKDKVVDAAKVVVSRAVVGPLNVAMSNKQVKSVAVESSGVGDVKRLINNPTPTNAGFVALSAAAYALPVIKAARAPIQALRAGELGAITVMNERYAASAAARGGQLYTKTMRLKNNSGVLNTARGGTTELFGKSVSTTGTKSIKAVEAATQRMMNQAGAADQALSRANSAGKLQGLLTGSAAVAAENVLTAQMKNKQNTKIKKK